MLLERVCFDELKEAYTRSKRPRRTSDSKILSSSTIRALQETPRHVRKGEGLAENKQEPEGSIRSPFWNFISLKCTLQNLTKVDWTALGPLHDRDSPGQLTAYQYNENALVRPCRIQFIELEKSKESIALQWIPNHLDILGNEQADKLAKVGSLLYQPDSPLPLLDPTDVIYTKTRLRTPLTDQSLRRPPHRKKLTRTTYCFSGRHPCTGSTFTMEPCVFSNHTKASGLMTFGIAVPITCAAHPSTAPFGVVQRTRKLDCNGMEPGRLERGIQILSQ
ncbi:uncharacterized protein TNCV_656291 [Trichonephila clavipes]|nr:uncharacterized protein TNCV_656291 [Trichonephila clavipes]